jgi:hypothetical protein
MSPEQILSLLRSGKADADLKRSVARGVLPLGPAPMLETLVLLLADEDRGLREDAVKSLRRMPKSIVLGVCSSADTSPALLHNLVRLFSKKVEILEKLLLNPSLEDRTVEHIATLPFPHLLEIIARRLDILERCPGIVANLSANAEAPGGILSLWEESQARKGRGKVVTSDAAAAVGEEGGEEEEFSPLLTGKNEEGASEAAEEEPQTAEEEPQTVEEKKQTVIQMLREMSAGRRVAIASKGNGEVRKILIRDKNRLISQKVLDNPRITDSEVEMYAKSTNVSEDVLRTIGSRKEWVKKPTVVRALVANPKTPLGIAIGFLNKINVRELEGLSRNRNIPEALRKMAQRKFKEKKQS